MIGRTNKEEGEEVKNWDGPKTYKASSLKFIQWTAMGALLLP